MNTLIDLIQGTVLDPIVLGSAAVFSAMLLSGAAARAMEFNERRRPRRWRRVDDAAARTTPLAPAGRR